MDLMGKIFRGVPENLAVNLKSAHGLEVFVETGTFKGRSARWASSVFKNVYTIESNYDFYASTSSQLCSLKNVVTLHGLSQQILGMALRMFSGSALIWLDAHWSRDLGYSKFDEVICPVLRELAVIAQHDVDHVILIDDLRLFGKERGWPTVNEVRYALELMGKKVSFETDVFVAVPNGKEK
jgi:hypothetical protein